MNEHEFNRMVDQLMYNLEEVLDNCASDIDSESSSGMLTLTVESNKSQIILSRQVVSREIWLADTSGGFHFTLREGQWRDTQDNMRLEEKLEKAILAQANERVVLNFSDL
ncbi:MAG: iron donor protein CyaY [Cellvibrionales bacterium TMED49]|nr:iron donor protein CyaY [Porticoccaceae bacterium]OUU38314.1 MAG: iron donor protein CyaY [Cellvibrionales bacterium TMED49]OUU38781.1 MAG: iron donor protein CyaY [Cellvibrionales bacterium TMED49]|tara:strand:+ start:517 stop:846 length:330 start_codon:yes stop_codon:yes gene_type:complete